MSIKNKSRKLRRSLTEAEKILWECLRDHRFHGFHFRRQYPVGNRYILDFYCAKLKLGIEVDGSIHQIPENRENDAIRTKALEGKNIRVLRFTNKDILRNIDRVLKKLSAEINFPLST